MKSKAYSSVLLTAVLLSALSAPSHAATIAGTKCTKVGTTKTSGGLKHFCVKSGNKLIWNKGTAVKTTAKVTPKATASPSVKPAASASPSQSKSASPSASTKSGLTQLTLEEVQKRNSATSCWSIVYGNVFDLTKWITKHPGGAEKIRAICGKDGTASFERQHTGDGGAANSLSNYFLGKLGDSVKL
jgi:cytochrome b involved in lipid metabolism